jgi:hypothetical protein
MDAADAEIAAKVQELSDLELAALTCFVAEQVSFIAQADANDLDSVERELRLVWRPRRVRTSSLTCIDSEKHIQRQECRVSMRKLNNSRRLLSRNSDR